MYGQQEKEGQTIGLLKDVISFPHTKLPWESKHLVFFLDQPIQISVRKPDNSHNADDIIWEVLSD